MRTLALSGCTLSIAAATLTACGGASGTVLSPSIAAPSTAIGARSAKPTAYKLLYSFAGGTTDGSYVFGRLVNLGGVLYGTTDEGGEQKCRHYHHGGGCGTVFTITPSGAETMLYAFKAGTSDGAAPAAGLIKVHGALYGTTAYGGTNLEGTVFSITPAGKETLLHSFGGSGDGAYPRASLLNVNGTLYGVTESGGANGAGTVFTITTSGQESVLYSFKGGNNDGAYPAACLISVNGTFYGTTEFGGGTNSGTVFSVTRSGQEIMLHDFDSKKDGRYPAAPLVNVKGTLYGTTLYGVGSSSAAGTVFTITTSGKEKVHHIFGNGDGTQPRAGLLYKNDALYGATSLGGSNGGGTAFSMTMSGAVTVLHDFGADGDGSNPVASLIDVGGTLYGTTAYGGADNNGTVFSLTP